MRKVPITLVCGTVEPSQAFLKARSEGVIPPR